MSALWLAMVVLAPQSLHASRMNHAKKVKTVAPLEDWEKEVCVVLEGGVLNSVPRAAVGTSLDAAKCRNAIAVEEAHCSELDKIKIGKLTHATFDTRCNAYRKDKSRIERSVKERVASGTIQVAVDHCEPAVLDVCVDNLCPIMCFLKEITDCDCPTICDDTKRHMWNTGSMDCEDKTFSDCQADLHESLSTDGRHPELEALMREHTMKCICVSWRTKDTRDICYQGSKGITPGTRWCDFTDTPSWTNMLNNYPTEHHLPRPDCQEIPGKEEGAMESAPCAAAPCVCSWAAPNSPLSFGIVVGVLWLAAISF